MKKFFAALSIAIILTALTFPKIFGNIIYAQDSSNKLDMLEIVISNLIARIESLEKRVNALEKNLSTGVPKATKKEVSSKESTKLPSLTNGFEDIGKGFSVGNVRFNPFGTNVLFTGEMANRTEKNYRFAKFKLEIYDDRDLILKEEEFNIWTGTGGNGKSKTISLHQSALGKYSEVITPTIITMKRNNPQNASPEIAKLKGKRFVAMQEPESDDKINVGCMKSLTGNDKITGRNLYELSSSFFLMCKFLLACNDLPMIASSDGGTWRRIFVTPFESIFKSNPDPNNKYQFKIDKDLKAKMETWKQFFITSIMECFIL